MNEKDKLEKQFIKLFGKCDEKSFDDEKLMVTGVIGSDDSMDRHGDRINPKGWVLENFKNNPVILINHDYHSLPVAKAINVRRKGNKLLFDIEFSKTYEKAKEAYNLLKEGILNAWSVGFIVLEWGKAGGEYSIEKMELLELSLVTVPANPNALTPRQLKSLEAINKSIEENGVEIKKDENDASDEPENGGGEGEENGGELTAEQKAEQDRKYKKLMSLVLGDADLIDLIRNIAKAEAQAIVEESLAAITKEVQKTESDEEVADDPKVLLLTSIREQLQKTNKESGKTLQAFKTLLNTIEKE